MRRLWKIIPQHYHSRTIWVVATIFVRAVLNFIGIATLIPVLILILDRNALADNSYVAAAYDIVGADSYTEFVAIVCAAVVGVILAKNGTVMALYNIERNYIYSLYKHLSTALWLSYRRRGLSFIKHNNSALLTRNVNVVSLMFVSGVLKPIATIISETLLFTLIMVAIVWYAPVAALLAVGLFLPVVALFYFAMRRRLHDIGERENAAQRTKSRIVAESFRGYADIEVGGAFEHMYERFEQAMNEIVDLRKRNASIGMLPQMFTEVGLAVGLVSLVLLGIGSASANIEIVFGIFAVAAIRLVPSIRGIMSSWSTIRHNRHTIDTIADIDIDSDIAIHPVHTNERFHLESKIEIRDLCFSFADATEPTIDHLSLTINKGERLGIRGVSGVGKTTLFNLILGLYRPTSGSIVVDGITLDDSNTARWLNSIGYVSQSVFIADGTLAENIAFGCKREDIDQERVLQAIEYADLKAFVDTLPDGIDTNIGEQGSRLSGGQRQRIGIARALYKGCDVLLFDEATSSLDNQTEQNINQAIERLSAHNASLTIVVIAHRTSSMENCDRIITLER